MSTNDPNLLLRDFVAWVRIRRSIQKDAWIDEKTLNFVAAGIEKFLAGDKNPWPKPKGNKSKKDKMWECYYLTKYAGRDTPHMPQHSEERGAFSIIGGHLNISPKTVESHVRKAQALVATKEGVFEFIQWFSNYKGATVVSYYPANHPEAKVERQRRESSGLTRPSDAPKRGRPTKAISGESDPK